MSDTAQKIDSLKDAEKDEGGSYARWKSEIAAAEKETDKWRKSAKRIVKEYRTTKSSTSPTDENFQRKFNIFSANVGILKTALINQTPSPSVDREFGDQLDDVARVCCLILERALMCHNGKNFNMANILGNATQDFLVPGLGVTWHTYDSELTTKKEVNSGVEYEEVTSERILDEYVYYDDAIWSPARVWEEVRWVGRKVYMTKDAGIKRFGEKFKKVGMDYTQKKTNPTNVEVNNQIFQQAVVYEIHDKESKKVYWLCKSYPELLDVKPDYLKLPEFFPCPKFLIANVSNGQFIPIPDYEWARDQYRELNEINTRIALLVKACRVAGVYDKASDAIKGLLSNAAENVLVPVDKWAALGEKGGIKGVVDWLPLDQIILTLKQLLESREDVKNQIYEITGMADIIRGQSKATETLGAQKIKAQYASMRIQDRQKMMVQYASQVFQMQASLMRTHMDPQEIAKLAQVEFMGEDHNLIQQALQLIKQPDFQLRVQVESDSLSDIDFQAEKQDRMEYMTVVTNYLKETGQMIQTDPIMGPFLMQLLQFSLAGFKIGKKFEGQLDQTFSKIMQKLSQPQQPQQDPEQAKIAAQTKQIELKTQADQQNRQDQRQHTQQMQQIELQGKQQEAAVDGQIAQQKLAQSEQQFNQTMQQEMVRANSPVGIQQGSGKAS